MTHDPELVERVAETACAVERDSSEPWWEGIARAVLDLLDAEGRLCEPGERDRVSASVDLMAANLRRARAEVERLRIQRDDALKLLPAECHYHGTNVTRQRYGVLGPCCDSGKAAFRVSQIKAADPTEDNRRWSD